MKSASILKAAILLSSVLTITPSVLMAADECDKRDSEASPTFFLTFIPDSKGTELIPLVLEVRVVTGSKPPFTPGYKFTAEVEVVASERLIPQRINGKRCATVPVAVQRFFNHDIFYTISIGAWEWKIPISHPSH